MIEYSYLLYPREEEEKENENEEMNLFLNDDFLKFKKVFSEKDDQNIYKEESRENETNISEIEENSNLYYLSNKSNDEIILYNKNNIKLSKRGRKKKSEKNQFQCIIGNKFKEHNKFKPDNIRIKIKTHYHNFILNFFNDFIKSKFTIQRYKFRKISYSITKDVTVKNNLNLMNMTLKKFLSQRISKKYKCDYNQNEKTINTLLQMFKNENDKNLFNINYADFYNQFYLAKNKDEIINKFGLQNRTEFFYDFVQRINQKNYEINLIDIAENHFVSYFSRNTYSKFSQFNFNINEENKIEQLSRKIFNVKNYTKENMNLENKDKKKINDCDFRFLKRKRELENNKIDEE